VFPSTGNEFSSICSEDYDRRSVLASITSAYVQLFYSTEIPLSDYAAHSVFM